MSPRLHFAIVYAPETLGHLAAIERKHYGLIREKIEEHLRSTPETPTRNRKPLDQPAPFAATWELRFGEDNRFRVFYEISQADRTVTILAIGVKTGSTLRIGREEFKP
jgi:mRNA-degrading endonuclease RelE of RelBE toxin-antitoxin system